MYNNDHQPEASSRMTAFAQHPSPTTSIAQDSIEPPAIFRERAYAAMQRAGNIPSPRGPRLYDIAIIAGYMTDAGLQLKPYIVINYRPYTRLCFELQDGRGKLLAIWERYFRLDHFYNAVMLDDFHIIEASMLDDAMLHVYCDNRLVAIYPLNPAEFVTHIDYIGDLSPHLTSDGEIDRWVSKAKNRQHDAPMALDDLLEEQENQAAKRKHDSL